MSLTPYNVVGGNESLYEFRVVTPDAIALYRDLFGPNELKAPLARIYPEPEQFARSVNSGGGPSWGTDCKPGHPGYGYGSCVDHGGGHTPTTPTPEPGGWQLLAMAIACILLSRFMRAAARSLDHAEHFIWITKEDKGDA
jgi:hypothetical protein